MAAPITHVIFAKSFLQKESAFDEREFVIGASFPDIRYLGVIDRVATHYADVDLEKIRGTADSFTAGMMHHALTDRIRARFVLAANVHGRIPAGAHAILSLKLFEDEVLYDRVGNWETIAGYFRDIIAQERLFHIDDRSIRAWHELLADYMRDKPSTSSRRRFIIGSGFDAEFAKEIERLIDVIRRDADIMRIVLRMHDYLRDYFAE